LEPKINHTYRRIINVLTMGLASLRNMT
jgi:hypothetical protein